MSYFISTHFMNEAERCDRISLMHAGRVLVTGSPAALIEQRGASTLDDAFVGFLEEVVAQDKTKESPLSADRVPSQAPAPALSALPIAGPRDRDKRRAFDLRRLLSYTRIEALGLRRDPIRATLALLGSILLMFVMGYGISMDVENLSFAVLDRDQSTISRDYVLNLAGSRYFIEQAPLSDYAELDRRMCSGELSLALEIPPGFARDLGRGERVEIGA